MAALWLAMVLGAVAELALPWWGTVAAGFVAGLCRGRSGWHALGAGLGGVGLVWLLTASYLHYQSAGIMSARVARLMGMPGVLSLLVATAAIGGLVGGLAAATGYHARAAFGAAPGAGGPAEGRGEPLAEDG